MSTLPVNQILHGDSLTKLKTLPSNSIDCIVTSPPYWALRDYKLEPQIWDSDPDCDHDFSITHTMKQTGGKTEDYVGNYSDDRLHFSSTSNTCSKCNAWKGELGQEPTIDLFVNHMIQIFDECKRVLKKEGTCFVNMGDTYASGGGLANEQSFRRKSGINTESNPDYPAKAKLRSTMGKCLLMIPERFTINMINKGWILRNKIIWHKRNCMPSSAKDRFTVDYENIYFFVKSQKYYFKTQYEPHLSNGNGKRREGTKNLMDKGQNIHSFHKPDSIFEYSELGRMKRCIWSINPQPFPEAHFAVFPEKLVKQCLDAGCPSSDDSIVLDPFLGSGTTALVALKYNRKFVGIELSEEYIKIANKRLEPWINQSRIMNFVVNN